MPHPKIFDFDRAGLAAYDTERITEALSEQPEHYINHLTLALHLTDWAGRMEQTPAHSDGRAQYHAGYVEALRDVAAHLRQGDYLPKGGSFLQHQHLVGRGLDHPGGSSS